MDDELDHILLDQIHSLKRQKKTLKRLKRIMKNEHLLYVGDELIDNKIQFFENMIRDKSILHKKPKKNKSTQSDLLARNPVFEWYRNMMMVTTFGYKMFTDSITGYISYFKKGKD